METKEAIDILIANAVCCCYELNCMDHCPYYVEKEDELDFCKVDYESKLKEAVETIIKERKDAI